MSQPTSWMETRVANTATNAAETEIVALSNGNFVVIWRATENTGIAISDGHDIVGQLFNPIGEPIGSEFLVAAGTERNVGNFDLAADASGGFHIVYEADAEFGASIEHKAVSFKVNGSPVIGAADTVVTDSPAVKNGDPHLVMLEDGSLQIHYQAVSSGSVASYVKTYDQGTASGTFTTIQTVNGGGLVDGEQALAAAQLKNGNVVVIAHTPDISSNAHDGLFMRLIAPDGSGLTNYATSLPGTTASIAPDLQPDVAAQGDGFVVVWQSAVNGDKDVVFLRFDANGAPKTSEPMVLDDQSLSDNASSPRVATLDDDSFVITWVEVNNLNQTTVRGQHYTAAGTPDGDVFAIEAPGSGQTNSDPSVEILADGRIIVGFVKEDTSGNETARFAIYDVRQPTIDGIDGRKDVLTALYQSSTVRGDGANGNSGIGGDDVLYAFGDADSLFGQKGDDMLFSGDGNDMLDGGRGKDTASFAFQRQALTIDLEHGTAKDIDGTVDFATMVRIENAIGTDFDDELYGNDRSNVLRGGAGSDTLYGGEGKDKLAGGDDGDKLIVRFGNDVLLGQRGDDIFRLDGNGSSTGATNGHFVIKGGQGHDTLVVSEAFGRGVVIDLEAGMLTSNISGRSTVKGIEAVATSRFDTVVRGDDAYNILSGAAGDDRLFGRGSGDVLDGGGGNDLLNGGDGADYIFGDDGNDRLIGGRETDTLAGEAGNDTIRGGDGDDVIMGGIGDDILDGGKGRDTADFFGATGGIRVDLNRQRQNIGADQGTDTLRSIEVVGGAGFADDLRGNEKNNILIGRAGDDRLVGGGGKDRLDGGNDDDVLLGGASNDTLIGGAGHDRLDGGRDNDILEGESGDDILAGGTGRDHISGGTGNDYLFGGGFGGAGDGTADSFFFASGYGTDTIGDFETGIDQVVLHDFALTAAEVLALGVDTADGARFELSADSTLLFEGLTVSQLSESDFHI